MGECSFNPYGGYLEQVSFDFLFMNEETWLFPRSQSCQVAKLKLGCAQVHTQPHISELMTLCLQLQEQIGSSLLTRLGDTGYAGVAEHVVQLSPVSRPSSPGKAVAEHCPCLKTSGGPHSGVPRPPSADA